MHQRSSVPPANNFTAMFTVLLVGTTATEVVEIAKGPLMVYSEQGSQFSSYDWRSFLKANNLVASMSRRGNCHDHAVAESFFQLLNGNVSSKKLHHAARSRSNMFDYVEMFYNAKRRHDFKN